MKSKRHKIGLSGMAEGVRYRLGVANPLDGRRPGRLVLRHAKALEVLLTFLDPNDLGKEQVIHEDEFVRRFGEADGYGLLVGLLICWVCLTNWKARSRTWTFFASVTFCETGAGARSATVRISEQMVPILKHWLSA